MASTAQKVMITGGAKGIGAALVRACAAAGYDVLFSYRGSAEQAHALNDELGPQVEAIAVDLSDRDQVEALASRLQGETKLYGLIHNAGQSYDSLAATINQDRAAAIMQVNYWSLVRLVTGAIRPMMRAKSGRVIAIGSITAERGTQGNASYAATKGAVASYLRTLAIEVASRGITANTIAPGYVDTDMVAAYAAHREQVEKQIPAGRFSEPQEIAGLASYLLSPLAGYITGVTVPIDGGLSASVAIRRG